MSQQQQQQAVIVGQQTAPTALDNELTEWDNVKSGQQSKLGELVQYFQTSITVNMQNIPLAYIDPTVIAPHLLDVETPDDLSDDIIREATQAIEFDEGFPTVGGIPIWERLDGEPIPYYKLFKEYREIKYTQDGRRSISKVSERSLMPGRHLNALARVYHWQTRVRAYDMYKEYERQAARLKAMEQLDSKHAKVSNQLLDQAVDYLLSHAEQLSPKTAIQLAELAMKTGRLALGLNPDKPGSGSGANGYNSNTNITIAANTGQGTMLVNNDNGNGNATGDGNRSGGLGFTNGAGQAKDTQHLRDILQVLNHSGALDMGMGIGMIESGKNVENGVITADVIDINAEVSEPE